jgi:cytoskeletal protein CcmA (bactofilin family)
MSGVIQLLSTGTSQGENAQVKVIGQFLPTQPSGQNAVFSYGIFSNSDVTMNGNFKVTGDGHGNGNFKMNGNASITGNLSAVGAITLTGNSKVTGTKTPGAPRVAMPVIDLQHYRNIATAVYPSGKSFNGNFSLSGVIYVDGDASFNGNFSGQGTIVVKGKATINGNVRVSGAGDQFAIVAGGGVKINGNCTIDGWIYTHSVTDDAQFQGNGNATVNGGIAADVIQVNGNMTLNYKAATVDMPGASTAPAQFQGISWRRVR